MAEENRVERRRASSEVQHQTRTVSEVKSRSVSNSDKNDGVKRFYWKEIFMLSAPVALIAVGLVFVKVRSGEPTQSLLSKWPNKVQITKCEVRRATPLEISQGADFGLTMQIVTPQRFSDTVLLDYTVSEPDAKSVLPKSSLPKPSSWKLAALKKPVKGIWHGAQSRFIKTAHPLQQNYSITEETDAFKRSDLKSKHGIIEVDLWKDGIPAEDRKAFQLDTTEIAPPNVNAARKANFRIHRVVLSTPQSAMLEIQDIIDQSQGLMSTPQTVGKWVMEGQPNQTVQAHIFDAGSRGTGNATTPLFTFSLGFPKGKQPPLAGRKFRGLISISRGWPQQVTLEWPEKLVGNAKGQKVKFSAELAPLVR